MVHKTGCYCIDAGCNHWPDCHNESIEQEVKLDVMRKANAALKAELAALKEKNCPSCAAAGKELVERAEKAEADLKTAEWELDEARAERDSYRAELAALRKENESLSAKLVKHHSMFDEIGKDLFAKVEELTAGVDTSPEDDLQAALDYAAKELPEGWEIALYVRKDYSSVNLFQNIHPGIKKLYQLNQHDTNAEQIRAAVAYAKKEGE